MIQEHGRLIVTPNPAREPGAKINNAKVISTYYTSLHWTDRSTLLRVITENFPQNSRLFLLCGNPAPFEQFLQKSKVF